MINLKQGDLVKVFMYKSDIRYLAIVENYVKTESQLKIAIGFLTSDILNCKYIDDYFPHGLVMDYTKGFKKTYMIFARKILYNTFSLTKITEKQKLLFEIDKQYD